MADFFAPIGWIVIFALFFSIIESQLILPSHLINRGIPSLGNRFVEAFKSLQKRLGSGLESLAYDTYRPFMDNVITWRYATSAACLGLLIVALSLILSGRLCLASSLQWREIESTQLSRCRKVFQHRLLWKQPENESLRKL